MNFDPTAKQICINYHYVEDKRPDKAGIHPCAVAEFDRQIAFIAKSYRFVSVTETIDAARNQLAEKLCAITFDDGLLDQYIHALPILKKYRATATFFIITNTLSGVVPDAHKAHEVMSRLSADALIDRFNDFLSKNYPDQLTQFTIPKDHRITTRRMNDETLPANFKETMSLLPDEVRDHFLRRLFDQLNLDEAIINKELFMNHDQIKQLDTDGFFVENHTHLHSPLEHKDADFLRHDLSTASTLLAEIIGKRPTVLSYPHGRSNNICLNLLPDLGFEAAVTIERRSITPTDERYLIPRYDTNDLRDYLNTIKGA